MLRLAENQKHGKWNKSKRPIEFDVHVFEVLIENVYITEFEDRNKPQAKNNCLRQVGDDLGRETDYLKMNTNKINHPVHYGSKQSGFPAFIIHFPTSLGVSGCGASK